MNWKLTLSILAILAVGGGLAYSFLAADHDHAAADTDSHGHHDHGDHDDHDEADTAEGPHGGRLLEDGTFTLELAIVESGPAPEFRAWLSQADSALAPDQTKLTVTLTRPNGSTDRFAFTPESDYLRGLGEVAEPHSFDYDVVAEYAGQSHRWTFAAPEMQTTIAADAAQRAGIEIATVGPATLTETLKVYGQIKLNHNRVGRAVPRFSGIVREVRHELGDTVQAGEVLSLVETNQTLATIEVKAPISGLIVDRDVNPDETVAEGETLFVIADLSDVWIDLNIPKRDHARVALGQTVVIQGEDGGAAGQGLITWISPVSSAATQSIIARVVLDNSARRWRPGLFVKAEIELARETVPVAVRESGLQTLFDFTVAFSQHGETYQARPLVLGRRSAGFVEVLQGLNPGESYVVENSFLIKADIGKSGAAHDH